MRTHILFGLVTCALVCATATAPKAQSADIVVVKALLSGANEVPGVSSGAHGAATVTLNRTTGLTASHIHIAPPGTNGPVVLNFNPQAIGISGDFRLEGKSSTINPAPALGILTMDDFMFSVAAGAAYVNVHTQTNGGGEIRGQTCPTSAAANTFNGIALCTLP
jgi:hypothetical protein